MAKTLHWPTEAKVLELPRYVPYAEYAPAIKAYNDAADTEVVVMEDKVHFNGGLQWAYQKEVVKMSAADAELLASLDQVKILR